MAAITVATPITVQSTPSLPSQVTALTTVTTAGGPDTRLLRWAAAPWSADSSGAHCTRTAISRITKMSAAAVTAVSGRSRGRRRATRADSGAGEDKESDLAPAGFAEPVDAEDQQPERGGEHQYLAERLVPQGQQGLVDAAGLRRVVRNGRVDD